MQNLFFTKVIAQKSDRRTAFVFFLEKKSDFTVKRIIKSFFALIGNIQDSGFIIIHPIEFFSIELKIISFPVFIAKADSIVRRIAESVLCDMSLFFHHLISSSITLYRSCFLLP